MPMGQILLKMFYTYCFEHGVTLVFLFLIGFFTFDFYKRYVKVNTDTDNVDLMQRYLWLQMHRRYYDENL
jgi:hypothetical protein